MLDSDSVLDPSGGSFCFDQKRGGPPQFEIRTQIIDGADGGSQGIHLTAGYRRWLTFDADNLSGQDFCAFQCDDRYAVGVVADGVSQSFFGNIAARVVGSAVVAYLWERRASPPDKDEVRDRLNAGQPALAQEVLDHKLSETLDPMVRSVLNDARAEGSQTAFGGVVLDRRNKVASIYLLGDITAVVHGSLPVPEIVSANKRGRWSSAAPCLRGDISREIRTRVASVMLKSDGADDRWGRDVGDVLQYESFCEQASAWAENDDVAFVWLATEPVSSHAVPRIAVPPVREYSKFPPPRAQDPERPRVRPAARGQEPMRTEVYRHPYTPPRPRPRRPRAQKRRVLVAGAFGILTVALLTTYAVQNHHRGIPTPTPTQITESPPTAQDSEFPPTARDSEFPPTSRDNARPRAGSTSGPRRPLASQPGPERRPAPAPAPPMPTSAVVDALTTLAGLPQKSSGLLLVVVAPSVGLQPLSVVCTDAQRRRYTGAISSDGIAPVPVPLPGRYRCQLQFAGQSQDKPSIECDEGGVAERDPRPRGGARVETSRRPQGANALYMYQHFSEYLSTFSKPSNDAAGDAGPDADSDAAASDAEVDTALIRDVIHCRTLTILPSRG